MWNRHHPFKAIILAGLLCALAGLTDCGSDAVGTAPPDTTKVDTTKIDTTKVDSTKADSAKVRKDLARLAGLLARLPMPMGTRYFSAPAPKTAAAQDCRGEQDIFALPANPRGIMGIDTVTYIDSAGVAHCLHQEPTLREDHARYLFDPACGEAWERIKIEITPDDLLPRYRSRGTGRLRLVSGLEATIEAYELDMALDNSTGMPIIQDAHLRLAIPDGYIQQLHLVKSRPYRAKDFYPYWENPPPGNPVMGGPVLRGADTVGQAKLYADRTLVFQDKAGNPVTPE